MKTFLYIFTLSAAMIASSALGWAKSDRNDRGEKGCETSCEVKKEQCEKLKPDTAKFNACVAQVEKDCKLTCKEDDEKEHDGDQGKK